MQPRPLEEGVRAQPALGGAAVPIIGPLVNHHTRQLAAVVPGRESKARPVAQKFAAVSRKSVATPVK